MVVQSKFQAFRNEQFIPLPVGLWVMSRHLWNWKPGWLVLIQVCHFHYQNHYKLTKQNESERLSSTDKTYYYTWLHCNRFAFQAFIPVALTQYEQPSQLDCFTGKRSRCTWMYMIQTESFSVFRILLTNVFCMDKNLWYSAKSLKYHSWKNGNHFTSVFACYQYWQFSYGCGLNLSARQMHKTLKIEHAWCTFNK
jgi:hypothetical protein